MELNMLTERINDSTHVETTEREFWRLYLYLVGSSRVALSTKEIEVMSWIMANKSGVCYFKQPGSGHIREALSDLGASELTRMKQNLLDKGFIEPVGPAKRPDYLPIKALRDMQAYMRAQKRWEFSLNFPLCSETEQARPWTEQTN